MVNLGRKPKKTCWVCRNSSILIFVLLVLVLFVVAFWDDKSASNAENYELYLGDCVDMCGDGICQAFLCKIEVTQEGVKGTVNSPCPPEIEEEFVKIFWDDLRYFNANVTCPETAQTCPVDCSNEYLRYKGDIEVLAEEYLQDMPEFQENEGGEFYQTDFRRVGGGEAYEMRYFVEFNSPTNPEGSYGMGVYLRVEGYELSLLDIEYFFF